ncbi:MAG: GNAT family N-acetyltransferase [Actinomycetota bacterium]|nr:GNAT family N-acetyltransferase [Actinomycetota bacterium]
MPEAPLGPPVDFHGATLPVRAPLRGAHVLLRPLEPSLDAPSLFAASHPPHGDDEIWRYLPYGPYPDPEALRAELERFAAAADPLFFAAVPVAGGEARGVASYLRITPVHGSIEIGHIWFGPALQRSTAATEAILLLAAEAFDGLGYRRLEWKCNALNAASRRAAERFGFAFEGVFRHHQVVKGRNRDTAWYAITDDRWPAVRAAFREWLAPENFDPAGAQRRSLRELTGHCHIRVPLQPFSPQHCESMGPEQAATPPPA